MISHQHQDLVEFCFEWFKIKLIKRYRDREQSRQAAEIPLMFDFFEPFKMKLFLG